MPFSPSTVRNTREQFVLQKIEYYKVMEHISKSDWERHYFDTYKEAIKMFKKLKQTKRRVLIFACRDNELGELSTGLNDRFKDE
jgi:ACT domain-containing protein